MEIGKVIKLLQKKKKAADRAEKRLKKLERAEEITIPVRPLTYDEWKNLAVSKMLNHSDIQTTEAYIGLTQKKQDELMRQTSTQMCIG